MCNFACNHKGNPRVKSAGMKLNHVFIVFTSFILQVNNVIFIYIEKLTEGWSQKDEILQVVFRMFCICVLHSLNQ